MNRLSLLVIIIFLSTTTNAQESKNLNKKILNQLGVKSELTLSFDDESEIPGVYSINIANGFGTRLALSTFIFADIPITEEEYEKTKRLGLFSDRILKELIKGTLILYPNGLAVIKTKEKTGYLNWALDSKNRFLKITSKDKNFFPIEDDLIIETSDSKHFTGYFCNEMVENCLPFFYFKKKQGNSTELLKEEEENLMKVTPWIKTLDDNLFSRKLFFHEQISIKVPKELNTIEKEKLKSKFPEGDIPILAADQKGLSLRIAVMDNNYSDNTKILDQKENILNSLKDKYPNADIINNNVFNIKNRNIGMIDLTISSKDYYGLYRLYFVTHCNYRIVYGIMTCSFLKRKKWVPIFKEMIKSMTINEK